MLPPPLAWIDGFIHSVQGALSQKVSYEVGNSEVNPLVYRIQVKFSERVSGKNLLLVWNLFQMYGTRNDSVIQGKPSDSEYKITAEVSVKRRLGPPRKKHPLE